MARRKLLLADDSITIQKVVNLTFADEGIDVTAVGDGDAALERLSAEPPDILLADVNMPGPNGYEICELLRSDEATRNLPVILLVGSFEPFDETEAARVGANAYLTKPFQSIKQLVAQVNDLIDAAEREQGAGRSDIELIQSMETAERPRDGKEAEAPAAETPTAEASHFDDLGYATNSPGVSEQIQPDDIESLYSKSLATLSPEEELSDIGIDDEMIETSYSAEDANSDLATFDTGTVADANLEDSALDQRDTGPEATVETSHDSIGYISGYEQRFPEDPSKFESTIAYDNWKPADMRDEQTVNNESAPAEISELSHASDGNGSENPGEAYVESLDNGEKPEQLTNSGSVGEDTIRMEGRFDTRGSGTFEFDDTNLLDLSPAEENPVEITSPVNAIEQGSNKQIVTLSPELIEMIAQRVVEKLSEKY